MDTEKTFLDDRVEFSRKGTLSRYSQENILEVISHAMPDAFQKNRFNDYRIAWQKSDNREIVSDFPLNLYIEPVSDCNLRCKFCVRSRDVWKNTKTAIFSKNFLGFDQFKKIIDEGKGYNLPAIWMGASGEALLERNIVRMMMYAHSAGVIDTILITNGTLLNRQIAERLISIPITRLNVSIDAFLPQTYAKLRGGKLESLIRNIDLFLELRNKQGQVLPILRVTFVDQPENSGEKEDFIRYWEKKADMIDIQKYWNFDVSQASPNKNRNIVCAHPWRSLFIMANGDVFPCCSFYAIPEHRLGNIDQFSIKEIWDSNQLRVFREDLISGNYRMACQTCYDSMNG